jgi:hypothetical protein
VTRIASVAALAAWLPLAASAQQAEIEIEDDVEIEVEADPEPEPAAEPEPEPAEVVPPPGPSAELVALREEVAALTTRLTALETEREEAEPAEEESPLELSGYLQAQYQWSDLSEDEVLPGGASANLDRFAIRRGRLRLEGEWEHFGFEIELDGSTTRGLFFGLRRTTVSAALRREDRSLMPYLEVSAGITEVPFGHEVRAGQRDFPFMERSLGSLALFPGPLDIGLRARGALGPFRYDLAVMSGTPLDDRAGGEGLDPTAAPDLAGRLATRPDLPETFELEGGVSFLWGTGFHAGEDAVKGRLEWRDLNESGTLDTGETIAIPGRAATPSETFGRWAINADLSAGVRTPIGWTRLYAEATLAENLDRGLFAADPVALGLDVRELAIYAAATQEITEWLMLGFRYDFYDPNSDLVDQRRGIAIPADASIHTLSPIATFRVPERYTGDFRLKVALQYDAILDALGRDTRGVPADLANDQLTVRVQGEFR